MPANLPAKANLRSISDPWRKGVAHGSTHRGSPCVSPLEHHLGGLGIASGGQWVPTASISPAAPQAARPVKIMSRSFSRNCLRIPTHDGTWSGYSGQRRQPAGA